MSAEWSEGLSAANGGWLAPGTELGVYQVSQKDGKAFWTRVGDARINKDLSLTVHLGARVVSGSLNIRIDRKAS